MTTWTGQFSMLPVPEVVVGNLDSPEKPRRRYVSRMLLALLACAGTEDAAGDGAPLDCEAGEASADIGTGEYEWVDLSEGDDVTMVHGPQGGWHILGSVRIDDMYDNVE